MTIESYIDKNKNLIQIKDVTGCFNLLRNFHESGYIFRGVENEKYRLLTTIDRYGGQIKWQRERYLMREFQRRIHHYLPSESLPHTTLELLSLMQHYGVPTRLLDFTKSPFIALYFAVRDLTVNKNCALWAVLPHNLRRCSLNRILEKDPMLIKRIGNLLNPFQEFTRENLFTKWFMSADRPVDDSPNRHQEIVLDFEPLMMNSRLTLQQGLFLISGSIFKTFEETLTGLLEEISNSGEPDSTDPSLIKIIIPSSLKKPILKELELMNINASSLFGGLEGFSNHLKESILMRDGVEISTVLWHFKDE